MADVPVAVLTTQLDTSSWPKDVQAGFNRAQAAIKPISLKVDSAPLGRISSDLKELDRSLAASNARVIAFGATTGVLYSISAAFKNLISVTIDTEKQLKDIQVILQSSEQGFAQLRTGLFDIAAGTGRSFKEAATAAAEFARQGLGLQETLRRTRDALILSRTTALDTKTAISDLTAAVNTFQDEALSTTDVINRLVAVDTRFAVSSADLAEGIKRAGATAQAAGVSFDQLVGAITALQQLTARGGGVGGTALQRFFSRIDSAPAIKALEDVGIKTRDLDGELRPAMDRLKELADRFQNLGVSQRNQVATAIAGRVQFNQLNALLKDLARSNSIATEATNVSSRATDEAIRRNEELNTSLSALINKAKESGTALASAFGDKTVGPALKGLFKTINSAFDTIRGEAGKDSIGSRIGSGIIDGIGNALKGPGTVLISALIISLFTKVTGAAGKAIAELVGLNNTAKEQQALQLNINRVLDQGAGIYRKQYEAANTVLERHAILLRAIQAENAALEIQHGIHAENVALLLRAGYVARGVDVGGGKSFIQKSQGYIPNASDGLLDSMFREEAAVRQGAGGASSSARAVPVPNFNFGGGRTGQIVANSNEYIVKNFAGGDGSAVFNPEMVRQVGGFNNLLGLGQVERVSNQGFVPNQADPIGITETLAHFSKKYGPSQSMEFPMRDPKKVIQFGGYQDWRAALRYIDPADFQKFASPLSPAYVQSDYTQKKLSEMVQAMRKGEEFDPLYLRLGSSGVTGMNYITGHEGRHRSLASRILGIDKVPVLLDTEQFGRVPELAKTGQLEEILGRHYFNEANLNPGSARKYPASKFNFLKGGRFQGRYSEGYIPNRAVTTQDYYQQLNEYLQREHNWNLEAPRKEDFPNDDIYHKIKDSKGNLVGKIGRHIWGGGAKELYMSNLEAAFDARGENRVRGQGITDKIYSFDRQFSKENNLKPYGQFVSKITQRKFAQYFPEHAKNYKWFNNLSGGFVPNLAQGDLPPLNFINDLLGSYRNLSQNQRAARDRYAFQKAQELGIYQPGMSGFKALKDIQSFVSGADPARLAAFQNRYNPPPPPVLPVANIASAEDIARHTATGSGFSLPGPAISALNQIRIPLPPPGPRILTNYPTNYTGPRILSNSAITQGNRPVIPSQAGQADPNTLTVEESRKLVAALNGRDFHQVRSEELEGILGRTTQGSREGAILAEREKIGSFFAKERGRGFKTTLNSPVSDAFSTFQTRLKRAGLDNLSPENQGVFNEQTADIKNFKSQRNQQRALGLAFLAPVVGQALLESSGVDPNSRGGRTASGVLGGISTGVAVGTLGGGPILGGLTAAFLSLRAITTNLTKSFEEVAKEIDEANNKRQEESNNIGAFNQSFGNLVELVQNPNADPRAINRATRESRILLGQTPQNLRPQLAELLANPTNPRNLEKANEIAAEKAFEDSRKASLGEAIKRFTLTQDKTDAIRDDVGFYNTSINFGGLAGSRRTAEAAFQPNAGIGGFFERRLLKGLTGKFNPITAQIEGGVNNLEDLNKIAPKISSENFVKNLSAIKGIGIPDTLLKETDFEPILKQVQDQLLEGEGGGDTRGIFSTFLKKAGFDPEAIKSAVDNLGGSNFQATQQIFAFFADKLNLQDLSKKVEESSKKAIGSFRDFLKVTDDILKDVAHNFSIQSLRDTGQRNLGLKRAQGLLDIAAPSLTPTQNENFQSQNTFQGLANEHINSLNKLVGGLISKFDLTEEALGNIKVQKAVANAAIGLTNDPLSVVEQFKNISAALKDAGVKGEGLQGGAGNENKIQNVLRELARDIQKENEEFVIKYRDANQDHVINLTRIQVEQARNFLGGDFRKLQNFDFSKVNQGLGPLQERFGRRGIVGGGRFENLTGNDILTSPEHVYERKLYRPSGSALLDAFHPLRDLEAERQRTIRRSAAITNTGQQLQSLGLLDHEPGLREKYAGVAAEGAKAQFDSFLNSLERRFARAGQFEEVLAIRRERQRPEAREAEGIQAAELFKTGHVSSVTAVQNQIQLNRQLSDSKLAGLQPLDANTSALLQNKKSIEDLKKSLDALIQAQKQVEKDQSNKTGGAKVGEALRDAQINHTGSFDVDVKVAGSNSVDQTIQNSIFDSVKEFKVDLERRLAAVERRNGIIANPPSAFQQGVRSVSV